MGQFLELEHQLNLSLSPSMLLLRDMLYMDSLELEQYLQTAARDNPFLQFEELQDSKLYRTEDQKTSMLWDEENPLKGSESMNDPFMFVADPYGLDIQSTLHIKAELSTASTSVKNALHSLIDYIETNGRLGASLEEINTASGIPLPLLETALTLIHAMDPPGMGARSLQESLLIQLQTIEPDNIFAQEIVKNHLMELRPENLDRLAKKMHVSIPKMEACFRLIKRLDPYPSCGTEREPSVSYVREELIARETDIGITLMLRDDASERIYIDQEYTAMLASMKECAEQKWMTAKQTEAQALVAHLQTRSALLLCCAQYLIDHQPEYFRDPDAPLRALTLSQASKALGLHISVLSRLISGKYLRIGSRLVSLRSFFSVGFPGDAGSLTASQIQAQLRRIILQEPKEAPYSDETLCEILHRMGIHISRRTIAKYRSVLGIPTAGKRKRGM